MLSVDNMSLFDVVSIYILVVLWCHVSSLFRECFRRVLVQRMQIMKQIWRG